jgi:hypothetical protein
LFPDFKSKNLFNDVALLLLEEPVTLAEHINVICMPEQNENFDRAKNCVANGWGKNVFGEYMYVRNSMVERSVRSACDRGS